jgi:hypothetical protein
MEKVDWPNNSSSHLDIAVDRGNEASTLPLLATGRSKEAATISNKLHPEFHKTQPTTVKHKYEIALQFERAWRKIISRNSDVCCCSPRRPFQDVSTSTWIAMTLRDNWINLSLLDGPRITRFESSQSQSLMVAPKLPRGTLVISQPV